MDTEQYDIKWPGDVEKDGVYKSGRRKGKTKRKTYMIRSFYAKVYAIHDYVLDGVTMSIDPSSGGVDQKTKLKGKLGFCERKLGQITEAGVVEILDSKESWRRVRDLDCCLRRDFTSGIDVLAVELLRGSMVPYPLWWSVSTIFNAIDPKYMLEVPIAVWKAVSKVYDGYEKGDMQDAVIISETVHLLAQMCRDGDIDSKGNMLNR